MALPIAGIIAQRFGLKNRPSDGTGQTIRGQSANLRYGVDITNLHMAEEAKGSSGMLFRLKSKHYVAIERCMDRPYAPCHAVVGHHGDAFELRFVQGRVCCHHGQSSILAASSFQ